MPHLNVAVQERQQVRQVGEDYWCSAKGTGHQTHKPCACTQLQHRLAPNLHLMRSSPGLLCAGEA